MEYRSKLYFPIYAERGKKETRFTHIEDIEIGECPVSFITPMSSEIVKVYAETEVAGVRFADQFGDDPPAWVFDAQAVLKGEERRYENARYEQSQD